MNTTIVPGLSQGRSEAAILGFKGLVDNMQAQGLISHGCVVDAKFAAEKGITSQIKDGMFDAPTDLASAIVKLKLLFPALIAHDSDGTWAHKSAGALAIAAATPTDQATANTYANELKADLNTHVANRTIHTNLVPAGLRPSVSVVDATDEASLVALTINIQDVMRYHLYSAASALTLAGA